MKSQPKEQQQEIFDSPEGPKTNNLTYLFKLLCNEMSNNDFGLNLNQFLAVIMLYKIRIKQDLYDTDDELLREIDLAMYCYGNHLAMTY